MDIDPALVAEDFTDPDPRPSDALARTEVLVTGWGCPRLDAAVLDAAPKLRAVLHCGRLGQELRHARAVASAASPSPRRPWPTPLPVAEYTLAMILLAGKDLFAARDRLRTERAFPGWGVVPGIGNHGRRVGVDRRLPHRPPRDRTASGPSTCG